MGTKLGKGEFPKGHGADDFKCFGPPATKDGEFDVCKIADLGCFSQDGVDSNKYYHGAVCQSKKDNKWYVYFEWGRTGRNTADVQFVACSDESDAQSEFKKQLMGKNVKRGQWVDIGGIKTLRAKPGEDSCYLVRSLTTRNVGLPDGRTIQVNEGTKQKAMSPSSSGPAIVKSASTVDHHTLKLMRDLNVATVAYARGAMASDVLPTQSAIDEGRIYLTEAQKRVKVVGDKVKDQISDNELKQLTYQLYSRIPKKKELRAEDADWILSSSNIMMWQQDLDAFESALYSSSMSAATQESDPFGGIDITMSWLDPTTSTGKWLETWWGKATANKHSYLGNMKIRNMWQFERKEDRGKLERVQDSIIKENPRIKERAPFQPRVREDLDVSTRDIFEKTNTAMLFHGTRSVNVSGILRKSLMLPRQLVGVSITGAMFGPGLYFADDWKKSAGYTSLSGGYYSSGAGGVSGRKAFMFVADVVLGNPWVAPHSGGYTSAPSGHHCVFGKAGHSGVQNNEWIVFSPMQSKLRYLAEFEA